MKPLFFLQRRLRLDGGAATLRGPGGFTAHIPRPFDPRWHPQLGARLAVFPRSLVYVSAGAPAPDLRGKQAWYWPDLATFAGDLAHSQMMYYPAFPSPYSVRVVYDQLSGRWNTFKYCDERLVRQAWGETFALAMLNTTIAGAEDGEIS